MWYGLYEYGWVLKKENSKNPKLMFKIYFQYKKRRKMEFCHTPKKDQMAFYEWKENSQWPFFAFQNAPDYLKDLLTLTSEISDIPTRTYHKNIWIPNHHISSIHRKSFRYEIPRIWNNLPENLKNCNTINTYKKHIKLSLLNNSLRFWL